MDTLFSLLRKKTVDEGEEKEEEAFLGGLLSPGPSTSVPSVKNDDASFLSAMGSEGEHEDARKEEKIEGRTTEEAVANRAQPQRLSQPPTTEHSKEPLQLQKELSNQADSIVTRSLNPTPKRSSSQTPFKTPFSKPSSTATMKDSRTPSSRSIVSSRSYSSTNATPRVMVPVKVHILAFSDRDNYPYHAVEPKYTCTLKLMSHTKAKEICLHAAEHMQRNFGVVLDGSSFEVRDQEGYLSSRAETVSEEVLGGDPIYLIEDAFGEKEKRKEKERDDLLRLQRDLERTGRKGSTSRSVVGYRTPSLSSRTSSSVRKWSRAAKSEPRKATATASQKASKLPHQTQSVPRPSKPEGASNSELLLSSEAAHEPPHSRSSVAPAKAVTEAPSTVASTKPPRKWTVRRELSVEQQANGKEQSASAETIVASQQSLPSPESSPAPQDNTQMVVPDSQQDPISPSPSSKITPVQGQLPPPPLLVPPKLNPKSASHSLDMRSRSAPATKTVDTLLLATYPAAQLSSLPSRPDPYDISTVLSNDENCSPRSQNKIMPSFTRKLGSSKKHHPTSVPPLAPHPAFLSTRHSSPIKREPSTAINRALIPSTPARPAQTPQCATTSSPAVAFPSSPTDRVAAAAGRAAARRVPQERAVVVYDSSDDVDETLLQEAPKRFSSSNQSQPAEASAHWSKPPLQLSQALDPFWTARPVGFRPPRKHTDENDDDIKTQMRRLGELGGNHAMRTGSGQLKRQTHPSSVLSPPKVDSATARPPKRSPPFYSGRYPLGFPNQRHSKSPSTLDVSKSPVIDIHGSSSETSDNVDAENADEVVAATDSASRPCESVEAIVISDTSSQYGSEDETGFVPIVERSPSGNESPLDEELPIEDDAGLQDQEEPKLPTIRHETPPFSTALEELSPSQSKAPALVELPHTDPFVEIKTEVSPPSAQPSKRRRELSEESDLEEEKRKKKARREERNARRLQRRNERKVQLELERARREEERKRLALEQARRRAQKLEIDLSSPSKSARLGAEDLDGYESSQESNAGYDECPSTPRSPDVAEPVSLEKDDNKDYSSSKEAEGRLSWRKLSKRHFSESPKGGQKHDKQSVQSKKTLEPSTTPVRTTAQDAQPEPEKTVTTKQHYFQREIYDDWSFLEEHLGRSQLLMDAHNRTHMQMMYQGIRHAMAPRQKEGAEPAAEKTSKAKSPDDASSKPKLEHDGAAKVGHITSKNKDRHQQRNLDDQVCAIVDRTPRSDRSAAPSPKEFSVACETASKKDMVVVDGLKDVQADLERQRTKETRRQKKKEKKTKKKQMGKNKDRSRERAKLWRKKHFVGSFRDVRHALIGRRTSGEK